MTKSPLFLSLVTILTVFSIYFSPFSSTISPNQEQKPSQDSIPIKTTINNNTHNHNHQGHQHTHKPEEFCAFDELQNKNPQLKQKQDSLENILYRLLQNGQAIGTDRTIYTIPVVVHVVHNNGAGNIPFTQVQAAIQQMNDAYANVGYYNPNTGVDVEIQFCLAQRDPMGNATNGMTQTVSTLSNLDKNTQDLQLKNLIRWDPTQYVNIWTVGNIIGGVAGYAYLPSAHGANVDGIVLEAGYMGTSPSNTSVLIHEMGHYLGLYHPFQGGCTNNDCLQDGDRVCDTPPDNTTSRPACNTPPNSCTTDEDDTSINNPFRSTALGGLGDQPDLIRDYMDYSQFTCYDRFTQGQKDRMRFFLTGIRASLLASQGCVPACTNPVNIGFTASATTVSVGTNITFTNTTTNATTYEWFNNSVSFATTTNANLTFNTVGTYTIRLNANNGDPNCLTQDSIVITVTCPVQADFSSSNLYPAPGEPLTLTNNSTNATTYTWTVDGVPFSTSANPNYTFSTNGTYTICLTAGNGLCSLSYCQNYLVYEDTVDCGNTFLRTLGVTGANEFGKALEQAPDKGFFLAGGKSDSSLLIKLDASANPTWQRTFKFTNTINEFITDLKIDSDSNIIAIGYADNGAAGECFAFKYNYKTHTVLWAQVLGTPNRSRFLSVHERSAGGSYFITGQTATNSAPGLGCDGLILELDRNTGATIQIEHYNLGSCETFQRSIIHNNLLYATGRYNNAGGGTNRMRQGITEFDFTGTQNWSRLYITDVVSDARLYASDILVHSDSLVALGMGDDNGTSATDVDIFLFKTDLTGQISWAKKYNIVGGDTERPRRLVLLPDGYLILGYYNNAASANDIYLIKTDFTGNIVWTRTYGTALNETSNDILVLGGSIFFVGDSEGLGGGADSDMLFAKLDLNGDVLDTCSFIASLNITETDIINPYDGSHLLTNYARADVLNNVSATANNTTLAVNTQCQSTCQEICDNGIDDDNDGEIDENCTCSNTFVKILGDNSTVEGGLTIVEAQDGNFWIGGYRGDSALLIKMNPNGYLLWEGTFKITNRPDIILQLHLDTEGNLIAGGMGDAGGTSRTTIAFKFNPYTNKIIWSNVFDTDALLMTIEENPVNGNYLFSGGKATAADALFTELDRNTGNVLLARQYHIGTDEDFYGSVIYNNDIYLSSRFSHTAGSNKMRANITKLDMAGNVAWNKTYLTDPTGSARQYGFGLELDGDSLAMAYSGDPNGTTLTAFRSGIIKTNMAGDLAWASEYTLTGYGAVLVYNMAQTPDAYLLFGYAYDNPQRDLVLIKTDKQGHALWAKVYGGLGLEDMKFNSSNRIAVTDQNYYFPARTQSFGGGTDDDLVVIKTDTSGHVQSGCTFVRDVPIHTVFLSNPYEANIALVNNPSSFTDDINTPLATLINIPVQEECEEPCQEICGNGLDDDGDGLVDCFDPDCCGSCPDFYYDACPATCQHPPVAKPFNLQLEWTSPSVWHEFNTPIIGDLDGDGIPEVIGKRGPYSGFKLPDLVILDGVTGQVEATIATGFNFGYANDGPTIADTDNDGIPEIFIMSSENPSRRIFSYEYDGTSYVQQWISNTQVGATMSFVSSSEWNVQVADFNQDGISELYVINEIYNAQTGDFLVDGGINNNMGRVNRVYGYGQWESFTVAADVLPDNHCADCKGLELVAGGQVYSVHIDPLNPVNNRMTVEVDASNLARMGDGFTAIADMDHDGDLDAVVTTTINDLDSIQTNDSVAVFIWDLQTPSLLAPPFGFLDNINGPTISLANISDVNNNGNLNIGVTSFSKFKMLEFSNGQITQLWNNSTTDGSGRTGTIVFDFNGDGNKEVVYRDETLLRIFRGSNGATLFSTSCSSLTAWEYPVVADVDNDAQTELLCSCGGQLRSYGSNSFPWVPTRPLWNQHSFFNVNINSDLSVPKVQQNHHLVGDRAEMNSFLNPYSNSEFAIADAIPTIDTIYCAGDSMMLSFTVCNTGDFTLSSQTPISIYNANPTQTAGATTIVPSQIIGQNILPDSCLSLTWKLPKNFGDLYLVANDNASLPAIYDLSSDFPVTTIAECDYSNNLDSTSFNPITPNLELGPDTTVCENGIFVFNAGSGFASYRWQDGLTDSSYTAFESGLYWVEVISVCGDTLRDSVTVTIDTLSLINLGTDTTLCIGDSLVISVVDSSSYVYQWSPNSNISCDTCPTVTVMPTMSTLYQLVVTNNIGCVSTDSILISVENCDTLIFMDTTLCLGDSLMLNATINNAIAYQWQDGSTANLYTINTAGIYGVTISLSNGDSIIAGLTVSYTNCAIIGSSFDTLLCNGDSLILDATNPNATAYLWQDGSTNAQFTINTAGTYWVYTTLSDGSQLQDTTNVTYTNCAIIGSSFDTLLCNGDNLILDATNPNATAYLWQDGSTNAQFTINTAGTYWVYTTLSDGSQLQDTTNVTYTNCAIIGSSFDTLLCNGDSLILDATNPNATAYLWQDGSTNAQFTINTAGTYWVYTTLSDGSQLQDTTNVTYTNCAIIGSSFDTLLCNGDSLILDANNPNATAYLWQDGSTNAQFTINTAGTYWVYTTLSDGSQLQDTTNVTYKNCNTTIVGSRIDTSFCLIGKFIIFNKATSGAVSYLWQDSSTSSRMIVGGPGLYWVHITLNDGSQIHDTIDVSFIDCSQTFMSSIDTTVCFTDLPYVINAERSGGTSYLWNTGSTDKQLFINNSGIYTSTVTISTGNVYIDTSIVTIVDCDPTIFEKTDTTLCEGDILVLDATLAGATDYQWANGSTSTQQIISSAGTYAVTVTLADNSIISDAITISYENCNYDCNVFIPDAFTPNNDYKNDVFRLIMMGSCTIKDYQILIYNRWGQKVFESTDSQAGWDGTVGNQDQPRAVYMYIINYTLDTPTGTQEKQERGQITLLR